MGDLGPFSTLQAAMDMVREQVKDMSHSDEVEGLGNGSLDPDIPAHLTFDKLLEEVKKTGDGAAKKAALYEKYSKMMEDELGYRPYR